MAKSAKWTKASWQLPAEISARSRAAARGSLPRGPPAWTRRRAASPTRSASTTQMKPIASEGHLQAAGAVGARRAVGALRQDGFGIRAALAGGRHRPRPHRRAVLRALRRRSPETFSLVMLDNRAGSASPTSSGCRSTTACAAPTSSRRSPRRTASLPSVSRACARTMPADIAALPQPRIAVILGGKNKVYAFRHCGRRALGRVRCRPLGALGASFMITPSRRTHARLLEVTEEATRAFPRILWNGEGANPYPRLPRPGRRFRRHRRQRQHDGRGRRHRPAGVRVHALGRVRQVPPLPRGACKRTAPRGRCPSTSRGDAGLDL